MDNKEFTPVTSVVEVGDFSLPLTPETLYLFAKKHNMERERLRICDGMAVSYFPTEASVCRAKNKVVIDLSCDNPIEYDELSADDQVILYRMQY